MTDTPPKVEFALGSEVSPGHFFKSSFARSFASGSNRIADTKSLDYDFYEANATIVEEPPDSPSQQNNNFYSLVNFDKETEQPNSSVWANSSGKVSFFFFFRLTFWIVVWLYCTGRMSMDWLEIKLLYIK